MNAKKIRHRVIYLIWIFITFVSLFHIRNKLSYIEFRSMNEASDLYIELAQKGDELIQEFNMPYEILYGISVKIGTFMRDNNSQWRISILHKDTGNLVYEKEFHASLIPDGSFYLLKLDKQIRLERGQVYELHIVADSVSVGNSLAFYRSKQSVLDGGDLYVNGKPVDGDLCFKVYGGDYDSWWSGFVIVCAIYVLAGLSRMNRLSMRNQKPAEDKLLQCFVLAGIVFLLLSIFSVSGVFCDENDNFLGGLLIAKGRVIYRDYVTQHTPFTYYLCAFYAWLGASSIQQFRLSYYFTAALVWGLMYYRHASYFGNKKMFFFPVLSAVFVPSIVEQMGSQVLADGVQGLCMVVLLLEYLRYYDDKELKWGRSWIVSVCILGSFGSAFVSAYALIWVVGAVLVLECLYWRKKKITVSGICQRYYRLIISMLTPLVGAVVYLAANGALVSAYQQAYKFNREVYARYIGGFGDKFTQPFIYAVQNFFNLIFNSVHDVMTAWEAKGVLQLAFLILASGALILLFIKKEYGKAVVLFLSMICSATRDYGFHGLAAWYVLVLIVSLYADRVAACMPKIGIPVVVIAAFSLLNVYINLAGTNLLAEQPIISDIESTIIANTEKGEDVFIDGFFCSPLYLIYKDRYPVNRMVYILPWYMDWYEQMAIEDLEKYHPHLAVYNEEQDVWGYTNFANVLTAQLKSNYTKMPDYPVWVRQVKNK